MTRSVPQTELSWALIKVSFQVRAAVNCLAEMHNLSVIQLYTLCSLEPDRETPMNRLSEFLFCDPSNVTGVVDRLLQRGYIVRHESSTDRRIKNIQLTQTGVRLREKIFRELGQKDFSSLEQLDPDEREQFISGLLKIMDKRCR